ncbi:kelch repeat protein-like protein [Bimuria novae-zelandiae CBS 107.79]|uniref:Kelch repeat protein-like protein n=1 Tax=Bimuria novae-zelandiae CBS 107.79 TaxID=1447943 RepID=A0A6A5VE95_9PLEO|nr:kelch repeat protein-like protein [Bimuria novae-zelandiae CBS 107.79]
MPISKPIWHLTGTWTRQHSAERLRRSSHVLSVLGNNAYIFSGEVQPREPVDDRIDVLPLSPDAAKLATLPLTGAAPTPRVGSASATLNGKMYIFSGRGGTAMEPVDEAGGVWAFDPEASSWTLLKPAVAEDALPPARSYHCAASDGATTLFIHAGCPASGRLSDLWKFDIESRAWKRCADAPGPPRGGTSIAYCGGKMYRMGGFDGSTEVGGSVDVYDPAVDTWSTETFTADGHNGPEPRSVCALLPVRIAQKDKLLTLFGERDPSALGHAGAGKMLGDVWLYDVQERWWTKLEPKGSEGVPDPRGWFDADVVKAEEGNDRVVVHGGLGENNERLTDAWVLSF